METVWKEVNDTLKVDYFTDVLNQSKHDPVVKKHHKIILQSIKAIACRLKELQTQQSEEFLKHIFANDVAEALTFADEADENGKTGALEYFGLGKEFGND
ncbi:MAG: hypothetical protein CMF52_02375 [Legionellales bacterium]|nr:hypothetical protein [Legionellales bacterium]